MNGGTREGLIVNHATQVLATEQDPKTLALRVARAELALTDIRRWVLQLDWSTRGRESVLRQIDETLEVAQT